MADNLHFTNYYDNQIQEGEMCVAHGIHVREQMCILKFWWEYLEKRDHLEDLGTDGKISK
jgi:hypothetical protein